MSQPISIPPLIPLPSEAKRSLRDEEEDVFATLFSPATPRGSPTLRPVQDESQRPSRHTRTTSVDSDFGSFVSVPSAEDPLHQQQQQDAGFTPFTPVENFNFFDKFTEDAKVATEKNKTELLDELFQNDRDPTAFLRGGEQSTQKQEASLLDFTSDTFDANTKTPTNRSRAATPLAGKPSAPVHAAIVPPIKPPLTKSPSPPPTLPPAPQPPSNHLIDELVDFDSDPSQLPFQSHSNFNSSHPPTPPTSTSLLDLDPLSDSHLSYRSRHPSRLQNFTSPSSSSSRDRSLSPELSRSPSLPPTPIRLSTPEVQRTQSYFAPSSLVSTTSSLTSRWMSSLLSRPQPPPPTRAETSDYEGAAPIPPPMHGRAATMPGSSITHGTPFGSTPYVPPSGAPGFAGDRTWDKGFQFDREGVERASLKLVGRKEVTVGVLTVDLADKLRPYLPALKRLARSWSLLYSLDQHGISLNTLYTRCEAHMGGALVVMRDSNDAVFGVWMGEGIKLSKGSYYGSGESFLFRVLADDSVRVYKWTGKNDYVALCEQEYISFGGGDGHYGLYLDDTLSDGSSARCPTFENEPLCSPGPRQGENVTFECVGLEVWGVG